MNTAVAKHEEFFHEDSRVQLMSPASVSALSAKDSTSLPVPKVDYGRIAGMETAASPELKLKQITYQLENAFRRSLSALIREMADIGGRFKDNENAVLEIIRTSNIRIDDKFSSELYKFMDQKFDEFFTNKFEIMERLEKSDSVRFNEVHLVLKKVTDREVRKQLSENVDKYAKFKMDQLNIGGWALVGQKDAVRVIALLEQCFEFFGEMLRLWSYVERGAWTALKDLFTRGILYDRKPKFEKFFDAGVFPNKKLRSETKEFLEQLAILYSSLTLLRDYDFDYMKMAAVEKHFLTEKQFNNFAHQFQVFHKMFHDTAAVTFDMSHQFKKDKGMLEALKRNLELMRNEVGRPRINDDAENKQNMELIDRLWNFRFDASDIEIPDMKDATCKEMFDALQSSKFNSEDYRPNEKTFFAENKADIEEFVRDLNTIVDDLARRSYRGLYVKISKAEKDDIAYHSDGHGAPLGQAYSDGSSGKSGGSGSGSGDDKVKREKTKKRVNSSDLSQSEKGEFWNLYDKRARGDNLSESERKKLDAYYQRLPQGGGGNRNNRRTGTHGSFGQDDGGILSLIPVVPNEIATADEAEAFLDSVFAADGSVNYIKFKYSDWRSYGKIHRDYGLGGRQSDDPKDVLDTFKNWHTSSWRSMIGGMRRALENETDPAEQVNIMLDIREWMFEAGSAIESDLTDRINKIQNTLDPGDTKMRMKQAWTQFQEAMQLLINNIDDVPEADAYGIAYHLELDDYVRNVVEELEKAVKIKAEAEEPEDQPQNENYDDPPHREERKQGSYDDSNTKVNWRAISAQPRLAVMNEEPSPLWDIYNRRVFGIVGVGGTEGGLGEQFTYNKSGGVRDVEIDRLNKGGKDRSAMNDEKFKGRVGNYRVTGNKLTIFRVDEHVHEVLTEVVKRINKIMESWNSIVYQDVSNVSASWQPASEKALFLQLGDDGIVHDPDLLKAVDRRVAGIPVVESASAPLPQNDNADIDAVQVAVEMAGLQHAVLAMFDYEEEAVETAGPLSTPLDQWREIKDAFKKKRKGNIKLKDFKRSVDDFRVGWSRNELMFKNQRVVVSQIKEIRRILAKIESMHIEKSIQVLYKDWKEGKLKHYDADLKGLIDVVEDRLHDMEDAKFLLRQVQEESEQLINHITQLQEMLADDGKFEGNVMYEDRIRQGGKRQTRLKLASAGGGTVEIPVIGGNGAVEVAGSTMETALIVEIVAIWLAIKTIRKKKARGRVKKQAKLKIKKLKEKYGKKSPEYQDGVKKIRDWQIEQLEEINKKAGTMGIRYEKLQRKKDKELSKSEIKKLKEELKRLKETLKKEKNEKASAEVDDTVFDANDHAELRLTVDEISSHEMNAMARLGVDRAAVANILDKVNSIDYSDTESDEQQEQRLLAMFGAPQAFTEADEDYYDYLITKAFTETAGLEQATGTSMHDKLVYKKIKQMRKVLKKVTQKYKQARKLAKEKIDDPAKLEKELQKLKEAENKEKEVIRDKAGHSGLQYDNTDRRQDKKRLKQEKKAIKKERKQNKKDKKMKRKEDRKKQKAAFMTTDELRKELYAEIDDRNDPEMQLTEADFTSINVRLADIPDEDFAICAQLGMSRSDVAALIDEVNSDRSQDWDEDEKEDAMDDAEDVVEEDEESDPEFVKFDALVTDVKEGIKSKCGKPHQASKPAVPAIPVKASKSVNRVQRRDCIIPVTESRSAA